VPTADSAGGGWCDSHGIGYILRLAKNPILERAARDEIERAERQFQQTAQPQRDFGSLSYGAASWDRSRRVIVNAERAAQGQNPRLVVANVPGGPLELYEHVYCQRGEAENRIEEQQLDLLADRTSCHQFVANEFRLLSSSANYVLFQSLRWTPIVGTELAQAQLGTIHLKLFKVAARIVVWAHCVLSDLSSSYPCQTVLPAV
jgi:hypothetical protein